MIFECAVNPLSCLNPLSVHLYFPLFVNGASLSCNRPLTQCYQEVARSVFLSTGDKKRKSHSEVQDKVSVLWANAKLFDKGIKLFAGKNHH